MQFSRISLLLLVSAATLLWVPPAVSNDIRTLVAQARQYASDGEVGNAIEVFNAVYQALIVQAPGDSLNIAFIENELSVLHRRRGDPAKAAELARSAIANGRAASAPVDRISVYLFNLSLSRIDLHDYQGAERTLSEIADMRNLLPKSTLHNVLLERGKNRTTLGDYSGAEQDLIEAIKIVPTQSRVPLEQLVALHLVSGDPRSARRALDRLIALVPINETASILEARVLIAEGAFGHAAEKLTRVFESTEVTSQRASAAYNLAEIQFLRGDYTAAARTNRQAERLYSELLGNAHPTVIQTAHRQALVLQETGDLEAAAELYSDVLDRIEAHFGRNHPLWIATLIERTETLARRGDVDAALADLRVAQEAAITPRHNLLARSALGLRLADQRRDVEAREVLESVVSDWTSGAFGMVDAPPTMLALADLYVRSDNFIAGFELARDAAELLQQRGANGVSRLSEARRIQASALLAQGKSDDADALIVENLDTAEQQLAQLALSSDRGVNYVPSEMRRQIAQAADRAWRRGAGAYADLFRALQLLHINENSAAALVTQAASDDGFGALITERKSITDGLRTEYSRLGSLASDDPSRNARLTEIAYLETQLSDLDKRLQAETPEALAYLAPRPVPMDAVQQALAVDEALWIHGTFEGYSFAMLITHDDVRALRSGNGAGTIDALVQQIRQSLRFVPSADGIDPAMPFAVAPANIIHQSLFAPLYEPENNLASLFVMPDGALQQIPLSVLVVDASDDEDIKYLGIERAVSRLLSARMLVSRDTEAVDRGFTPMIGFGDPAFEGTGAATTRAAFEDFDVTRGLANPEVLRGLTRLESSAKELRLLEQFSGDTRSAVYLGQAASERQVKTKSFKGFPVVSFATHGIVAGDFSGLRQPALALSPPDEATTLDDGLLLASEILSLKFDRALVILSACNTGAASGRPGAPGLSGLARAFFYAGAETMLVSHWEISSKSSVLITPFFYWALQDDPSQTAAQALQRTMRTLFNSPDDPDFAHPIYWAAFSVVGTN